MKMENMNLNPLKFKAKVFDQMASEDTGYSNYSYWRSTFRTFFKNKAVMLLVILIVAIIVMGFVYPMVSDIDPNKVSLKRKEWNQRPTWEHWFGTDQLGRDIWTRAWYGVRNSFVLAFAIGGRGSGFTVRGVCGTCTIGSIDGS